ncbi:leucyl aminopeptidase [Desulfogranum mediterraneum]|uniref:leucyl aminopeptidase n=1 Tax=Desulfogranum mediterraneum TaxID=160661 RepID=UPI0004078EC6|nr:leucyl aminopeptidase [Desulfogranum mediterraneum]
MIKLTKRAPEEFAGDLLVYLVEEEVDRLGGEASALLNRVLYQIKAHGDFSGKQEEFFWFYPRITGEAEPDCKARRVLLVGLGKQDETMSGRLEQLRLAGGVIAQQGAKVKAEEVLVVLPEDVVLSAAEIAEAMTEGLLLGNYRFDHYKTPGQDQDKARPVATFLLSDGGLSAAAVRRGMNRGRILAEAGCSARDMANQPGNSWTPAEFADYAKKIAKKSPLKCKIIEKATMKKLGMGGILGVNQGSAVPPKLVILEYRTNKNNPTVMLVGKGLTFDSGGISIKPAAGMEEMKYDMCGGAAVLTAMQAIGEEQPAGVNVIGLIPTTDNMSGAAALKPGDIISHFGGKSAEIINTDAEGRLILADALAYGIESYEPEAVIDLATLTGAVIVGLGHHRSGLISNNDQLAQRLLEAGERSGEPLWRLPIGPEYRKQLDSQVADLKNTGGKSAGTITAACYLQEFVGETPWAHLDIAGTAWGFTEKSYIPKGPSGIAARTLVNLLRGWKSLSPGEQQS